MASVSGSDFVSGSDVSADAFSGTSQSYKATNVVSCHLLLCGAVLLRIGSEWMAFGLIRHWRSLFSGEDSGNWRVRQICLRGNVSPYPIRIKSSLNGEVGV